jgi:hypothetical protein
LSFLGKHKDFRLGGQQHVGNLFCCATALPFPPPSAKIADGGVVGLGSGLGLHV